MMLLPPLAPERARRLATGFSGAKILVIGDAMLDRFIAGRVTRISPEAPVPVVTFAHETHRIGGAANVAHNVSSLGGHAVLLAITGQDDAAGTLAHGCLEAGIEASFVADPARPTTTKVRVVTERNQQVARIDYEIDAEISAELAARLVVLIEQHAPHASAIIVSDYLKGGVTWQVMRSAVRAAAGALRSRCSSIRRSRISITTPARPSSRQTITRRRPQPTCACEPRTTRAPPRATSASASAAKPC